MSNLVTKITAMLVEIKSALARHAEASEVDALELELLRAVTKAISTGEDAVGHARVVFLVERMKLEQKIADHRKQDENEAWAAAVAAITGRARRKRKQD